MSKATERVRNGNWEITSFWSIGLQADGWARRCIVSGPGIGTIECYLSLQRERAQGGYAFIWVYEGMPFPVHSIIIKHICKLFIGNHLDAAIFCSSKDNRVEWGVSGSQTISHWLHKLAWGCWRGRTSPSSSNQRQGELTTTTAAWIEIMWRASNTAKAVGREVGKYSLSAERSTGGTS